MPSFSGTIFINYRKADSNWNALALYNELQKYFNKDQLFKDFNTIRPGDDFVVSIEAALQKCDVLLVMIGKEWLAIKNSAGLRRLDLPDDFVRLEIATALQRNIRVIPVLFDDTPMPDSHELPDNLKALSRRQKIDISNTRFEDDVRKLASEIHGQASWGAGQGTGSNSGQGTGSRSGPPPGAGTGSGSHSGPPPGPGAGSRPASPPGSGSHSGTRVPPTQPATPKPNSNLALAILATIFCCLPLGIPAIVAASKVDRLYQLGQVQEAQKQSAQAKKWVLWSAIAGIIVWIIYLIIVSRMR